MKLKEIIKWGNKVQITNGTEVVDAHISRINKTCFILSAGNIGTFTYSFTGRIINPKNGQECWKVVIKSENEDLFETLAQATKPTDVIKPKNAIAELKVWNEDRTNFHYVIKDAKGGEMILSRGSEYLEFKIAQQEYIRRRNN